VDRAKGVLFPCILGMEERLEYDGCIDGCWLDMIDACIDVRGWDTPKVILKFLRLCLLGGAGLRYLHCLVS